MIQTPAGMITERRRDRHSPDGHAEPRGAMMRALGSHWTRAAGVAALLAAIHTWPLITNPAALSRNDNADAMLNEWIVAWVQHQLPRDPLALFQGNIFYPARDTLAFSEPLIVPAILGAPVRLAGGSPVLVNNVLLLTGLTFTMLAMYALVREWTGDEFAALAAGSAFAFNAHMLTRLAHLQAMHAYGLPLALLSADRLVLHARTRDSIWLAFWMTVMAYTSGHFVVFGLFMVAFGIVARAHEWIRAPAALLSRLALAAVISAVAIIPIYLPYRRVADEQGMVRLLEHVTEYSATLFSYLAAAGRVHWALWSARLFPDVQDRFFPGMTVLLLSIVAVVAAWQLQNKAQPRNPRRVLMLVVIATAGVLLSLGTRTPLYGWLYNALPPLHAIRGAARFGIFFILATAALAGLGVSRLRMHARSGRAAAAIGIAAIVLINAEALRAPIEYRHFGGFSRLYTLVAQEPEPVVLIEEPLYAPEAVFMNAEYMLNATVHWRRLVNGYSGYTPRTYFEHFDGFQSFPGAHAMQAMRKAGVTHVIVHPERYGRRAAEIMARCNSVSELERIAMDRQGATLYRLR